MSEMVERAARAIAEAPATHAHWGGMPVSYDDLFAKQQDALVSLARLVLLAALDPENEDLTELVYDAAEDARNEVRPVGRAIIEALRKATSQGGSVE